METFGIFNTQPFTSALFSESQRLAVSDGLGTLNDFSTTLFDTFATVSSGTANVRGRFYENDTSTNVILPALPASGSKTYYLVLRLNLTNAPLTPFSFEFVETTVYTNGIYDLKLYKLVLSSIGTREFIDIRITSTSGEVGEWTPSFVSVYNESIYPTSNQKGIYRKIGNLVEVFFSLRGVPAPATQVKIKGIPYPVTSAESWGYGYTNSAFSITPSANYSYAGGLSVTASMLNAESDPNSLAISSPTIWDLGGGHRIYKGEMIPVNGYIGENNSAYNGTWWGQCTYFTTGDRLL